MNDGDTAFAVTQRSVLRLYPDERLIQRIYPDRGLAFLSGFEVAVTTDRLFKTKKAGLRFAKERLEAEIARYQDRLDFINAEIEIQK